MKWVNAENKIPIKSWCEDVEDNAMEQAVNLANHPALTKHVALMPDTHFGYGIPIGGVIACSHSVIPNAVGVDIGCGVRTVQTTYPCAEVTTEQIKAIMGRVREMVPVGFKHHESAQDWEGFSHAPEIGIIQRQLQSATRQLGTLGGGNHFIELQKGDDGFLWIMIHSGSRNLGLKIAKEYHDKAIELCKKWYSNIPHRYLSFLPLSDPLGIEYVDAMGYALSFAKASRAKMMRRVCEAVRDVLGDVARYEEIDIHHNYAVMENHFGKNVMIHRKGATSARAGQLGIIPGSMGTPSYIVEGLGNPDSFQSCSHGAGRVMGRREASRTLTVEECDKAMEGVVFGRWGKDRKGNIDLGEAPQAYKNIEDVIEAELDLIKPVVKLWPLGVIKG